MLFDGIANYGLIPGSTYRVLIFRYLAFIIVGIALYDSSHKIKKVWKGLAIGSLLYIWMYAYFGYVPQIFSKWTNTSLPIVFWALTVVILGMQYLEKENTNYLTALFTRIGQGSYHIFLTQKVLFGFGLNRWLRQTRLPITFRSLFAIIICCFVGIGFQELLLRKATR